MKSYRYWSRECPSKDIANHLCISRKTVYRHLEDIRNNLNIHNSITILYNIYGECKCKKQNIKLTPRGFEVFSLIIQGKTIPNVEETIPTSMPVEEAKPIYGGVSPVIPKIEINNEEHRPIYGGANPLENTQSIPKINPVVTPTIPTVESVDTPITPQVSTSQEEIKVEPETTKVEIQETPQVDVSVEPKKDEVESLF